jgi:hypothetical protein
MNADTLKRIKADPAVFREHLLIDTDMGPVRLSSVADPWQLADFQALDAGWRQVARRDAKGDAPAYLRSYWERPRGHSKTSDTAAMATYALYGSRQKINGVVAAADKDQAKLTRDAIERLVGLNPWLADVLDVQTWVVRNKHTKSELTIISSDAATSWGLLADFICLDELSHWSDGNGERLYQSLVSAAAKRKFCMLAAISNAGLGSGSSWQWNARESFRNNPRGYFSRLDGPVASWITADILEEQRELLPPPAFARLWLNLWSTGGSDLLGDEDLLAAVTLPGPSPREQGWVYVGGLDLAVRRDAAALVIVGKRGRRLRVAKCFEWLPPKGGKISLDAIQETVLEAHETYRLHRLGVDPWNAASTVEQLQKKSVPIEEQPQNGPNLVKQCGAMLEAFQNRSIELYNFEPLLADLRAIRIEERSYGCRLVSPRGPNGHGDRATAMSIGMAICQEIPDHVGVPWQPIARRGMYGEDHRPGTWGRVGKPGAANPKLVWPF